MQENQSVGEAVAGSSPIFPCELSEEIERALSMAGLATSDLHSSSVRLFSARADDRSLMGVVGLEPRGAVGLLRSLLVMPRHRGTGLARALVDRCVAEARDSHMGELFLLTTSEERLFQHLGFAPIRREEVPPEIAATAQFRSLCPSTAVVMRLRMR